MNESDIEVGDQFADTDPRVEEAGGRVVKVLRRAPVDAYNNERWVVEVIQHWQMEVVGRRTIVKGRRLVSRAYRKVSR